MAGQPKVADLVESPLVIEVRVIDENVAAAQYVMELRDLEAVPRQIGNDGRLLGAQMRDRVQ